VQGDVAQTLCAVGVVTLCACGLDRNGLLDLDGGAIGRPATNGGVVDGSAGERGDLIDPGDASTAPDDSATTQADGTAVGPDIDALAEATASADSADTAIDSAPLLIVWDGGPIVNPQFSDADWVSFCVALSACGQMPSISACVALLHQPSSPDALVPAPNLVLSISNAGADCARIGQLLGDGSTCPTATADTCSGNSLVTCLWGFQMTMDCGPLGMVCSMGSGSAGCGFGDCAAAQEGKTYCVGSSELAQCTHGRYSPLLSCQTFGAKCVGPAQTALCQGTGGSGCNGGPSCNGTSIVECLGGLLGSADCAALYGSAFQCVPGNAGVPVCAAGTACDPASNVDTCMGKNQASFCNAGATANYDCKSSGWKGGCTAGRCTP
jgi:hypothetical protein